MHPPRLGYANLGLGVGLRTTHFPYILRNNPPVDWFEIITENFMDSGGRPRYVLEQIAERYPVVMHGVSMSIGSTDPLDMEYLTKLKKLADAVKPRWVSDHLCWTGVAGLNAHDLLPIPLNEESLAHVRDRVRIGAGLPGTAVGAGEPLHLRQLRRLDHAGVGVPDAPGRGRRLRPLARREQRLRLSVNHDFDPEEYIRNVPHRRVVQFHLAGHTDCGTHRIDTHDGEVIDPVWELYRQAHRLTGGASTLLEWDAKIPEFPVVHAEVLKAKDYMGARLAPASAARPTAPDGGGGHGRVQPGVVPRRRVGGFLRGPGVTVRPSRKRERRTFGGLLP